MKRRLVVTGALLGAICIGAWLWRRVGQSYVDCIVRPRPFVIRSYSDEWKPYPSNLADADSMAFARLAWGITDGG